ncbi:metallophosphoesterase family protein [Halovenus salina]|uniref:Metallophosphoesterase family protein n=1 Tax=Halovenus salina TaxID=1510225 RepID=A0ABD5W564_9EURY|nr:metallophosphoesterase [Halovenus salina]
MLAAHETDAVAPPARDSVTALQQTPTIVSISDIHGFLGEARSALLTLADHPEYDPIVESDAARRLHWAGDEGYVLVFNGDLIDRGPQSDRVVEMVDRLIDEAPPGHVRVTVGNHEMGVLTPELYGWSNWYAGSRSVDERRSLIEQIQDGHVVAAYEGYNVTYAHAGQPEPYDASTVNNTLVEGASALLEGLGEPNAIDREAAIVDDYPRVFGYGDESSRGPGAGISWLDFEYMPEDAPPQVVGHSRQDAPIRRENVICENVIRENRRRDGGEAVVVETPDSVRALGRTAEGGVDEHVFSLPVLEE